MELLEEYAGKSYISAECVDGAFKAIWKDCTKHWEYDGTILETTDNIFEHLQDIFMAYVYLKPGVKKVAQYAPDFDYDDLTEEDYAAILSMMYERFGGRPINPSKVESGDAIPRIGTGDILATLVNFPSMSIADKIYTYMIEVKYKNNDVKLASWLKEYEDVMGSEYSILDSDTYDNYMKAYQKAFQEYGQDSANDTLLDYGFVLTPDVFESKISYTEALNKFASTIRSHFGNSSFYNNRNNPQYVAKSYMMAKKMCENSAFTDITDIYACDLDVISHTVGYNSNMILLADTQVVELNDTYGTYTDTDHDGLLDYQEANRPELVDISNMVKEYCKYNGYSQAETEQMIRDNGKVTMYSYRSNPVLPDSDFDGRLDNNDGKPLDNVYNSKNETDNYSNISIEYAQDYRYFFMDDKSYYEELAEMGLVLSNMASKKNGRDKVWKNVSSGENYTASNLRNYMWYIGNDNIEEHLAKDIYTMEEEDVPYAIGQHDCVAILGKVNNLQKNIITLVIGENKDYKDILAANYDGSLGVDGSYEGDHHHIGYDVEATKIFENLVSYSDSQTPDWKKAYFIVGYGTGGSIANLVAKKMIDLKGNREPVFCYTYQAPGTINRNNLDKKIYNTKYYSIFNIINSDDPLLYFEEDDFEKYGRDKKVSAGYEMGNKNFSKNYLYNNKTNLINKVLCDIGVDSNDDEVMAFSLTDSILSFVKVTIDKLKTFYYSSLKRSPLKNQVVDIANSNGDVNEGIAAGEINNKFGYAVDSSKDAKYVIEVIKKNGEVKPKLAIGRKDDVTVGKLLNYIDELGVWYVNNVPSYKGKISGKFSKATTVAQDSFKEHATVSDDLTSFAKNSGDTYLIVNTNRILYKYDTLANYATNYGDNVSPNWAGYVGDDCNSFAMGVIRLQTKGQRGNTGQAGNTDGINLRDTNVSAMMSNANFENSMLNLGFHKYYLGKNDENKIAWMHKYIDGTEVKNKEVDEMSIKFLQPGDMLVCTDHVEFYNGFTYDVEYVDMMAPTLNERKKSGIKSINRSNKIIQTGYNNNGNFVGDGKRYSIFSWGNVHDEYPVQADGDGKEKDTNYYFKYDSATKAFTLYYSSGSIPQTGYSVIWRK